MSRFADADNEADVPLPASRGRAGPASKKSVPWLSKDTKLTILVWIGVLFLAAFITLEIAVASKSEDLDRTARATIAMHNETTTMRNDIGGYMRTMTENFPQNQGAVSLEQVVDSVAKAHAMMMWIDDLKNGLPPETVQQLVKSANTLVGNVSAVVGTVTSMFDGMGVDNTERHRTLVTNAAMFFAKGAELLSTVSPGEFHQAFTATHEAVQSMAGLSRGLDKERVNRIVESASDILGSVESEHIVSVLGHLVKGATEIMNRFTQPGGIRVSLPVDVAGPLAAAAAPVQK